MDNEVEWILPVEILIEIFHYLPMYDFLCARLCCKYWLSVSQRPEFHGKGVLKLSNCSLVNLYSNFNVYTKPMQNMILKNSLYGDVSRLFQHFSLTLRSLILKNIHFEISLKTILTNTVNLEHLELVNIKTQYITDNLSDTETVQCPPLKELVLRETDDDISEYMLRCTSCINTLNALTIDLETTTDNFFNTINTHSNLQNLYLRSFIQIYCVADWSQSLQKLHLTELGMEGSFPATLVYLTILCNDNLQYLNLSAGLQIDDKSMKIITLGAPILRVLDLSFCGRITDLGCMELANLHALCSLDISYCHKITGTGISHLFTEASKAYYEELYLRELILLNEDAIIQCTLNFPNLTVLNVGGCSLGVTDRSVREIFVNLTKLKELSLSYCTRLTDAGVVGQHSFNAISNLEHLQKLNISGSKKLTDITLLQAFKFPRIKFIDMRGCVNFTSAGVLQMVQSCSTIEEIHLMISTNMNTEIASVLSTTQGRLRLLKIYGWNINPVTLPNGWITRANFAKHVIILRKLF